MRLIDADKIKYITENEEKPSALDYARRSHIADEPTVKAIPMGWISEYSRRPIKNADYWAIIRMVGAWERENENL